MPQVEICLPELGEDGPDEATISFFMVSEGEGVEEGQEVAEVLTDKATFNVVSPAHGKVKQILVAEDERVEIGQVLAIIETA